MKPVVILISALAAGLLTLALCDSKKEPFSSEKPKCILYSSSRCGHCVRMKPEWHKLVAYASSSMNHIHVINEEDSDNIPDDVEGFPTIIYINGDNTKRVMYNGNRSFEDMKKWLSDQYNSWK